MKIVQYLFLFDVLFAFGHRWVKFIPKALTVQLYFSDGTVLFEFAENLCATNAIFDPTRLYSVIFFLYSKTPTQKPADQYQLS